ncbi:DUF1903-domain-containing protein [Rhizodiscina lignyota]|uniref:Cx9C motif-containing protein 4, mitochondrial n=1 Tax=Rhizodiscina lignyota TaxID=1504668 RepID=A0A9P4IPC2_9PEZI|nr:DUF1903-domain-containing protein [Rhizodiscina lignyota]
MQLKKKQPDLEKDLKTDPPCHPRACAIQGKHCLIPSVQTSHVARTDCLAANQYKEEKCQKQVDDLYACCNVFYQRNGDDASTASCPKANLLRLKMKQRSEGQK